MFAKLLSRDFQDSAHVRLGRVRAGHPLVIRTGLVWYKHRVQHQVGWCNGHSPANLHENSQGKEGEEWRFGFKNRNSLSGNIENHSTTQGKGGPAFLRFLSKNEMYYIFPLGPCILKKWCTRVRFPLTSGTWCFSQMKSRQFNYVRIKRS